MNGSRKLCPCCGQDIIIPTELLRISVNSATRMFLFRLYREMPRAVPRWKLGSSARAVYVAVNRAREALEDEGLPYRIDTVKEFGYCMKPIAEAVS